MAAVTVTDIVDALTDQQDEVGRLRRRVKELEDEAFESRKLIWSLAQAQGVKHGQPYTQADVIAGAVRKAKQG